MNIDLRNHPRVKYVENSNVVKMFNNRDHSTVTIFKKFYEDGYEVVKGFFVSRRKLNSNEEISNEVESEVYYSNNQLNSAEIISQRNRDDNLIASSLMKYELYESENIELRNSLSLRKVNGNKVFKNFLYFLLISIIILILIDICFYFMQMNQENEFERENCLKEYEDHSCGKLKISDGPILNEFCREKIKCINFKHSRVYFHTILSRFIREFSWSLFSSIFDFSYKSLITVIVIITAGILFRKFIKVI
jgi:hypothetical protein